MSFNVIIKRLVVWCIPLLLMGCSKDEQGLKLSDLQAEAIAQENQFRLTAFVNVSEFKSNDTRLEVDGGYFLYSAFLNNKALYLRFPAISEGTYLGADDPEIFLLYVDENGRNYFSNNDAFNSDVSITITAVDSSDGFFYADFLGTLYDIEAKNPRKAENQAGVFVGRINRARF